MHSDSRLSSKSTASLIGDSWQERPGRLSATDVNDGDW